MSFMGGEYMAGYQFLMLVIFGLDIEDEVPFGTNWIGCLEMGKSAAPRRGVQQGANYIGDFNRIIEGEGREGYMYGNGNATVGIQSTSRR